MAKETRAKSVSRAAGTLVVLIGALVLLGWAFNLPFLKGLIPGSPEMKPNTALGFLFAGISLYSLAKGTEKSSWRYISRGSALLVLLIGLLTLAQYMSRSDFGIDQILLRSAQAPGNAPRMAPHTAFSLLLTGLSLFLLNGRQKSLYSISEGSAFIVMAITMMALLGHLYGSRSFYAAAPYSGMALHTALSFALLGVGILAANRHSKFVNIITSNSAGGLMARRLLPVALLVPAVLGWLRMKGQSFGWYDTGFGNALMIVVSILFFVAFIFHSMAILHRIEAERNEATETLHRSEQLYRQLVESARGLICTHDMEGKLLSVNSAVLEGLGYEASEMIGRNLVEFLNPAVRGHFTQYLQRIARDSVAEGLLYIETKTGVERVWKYQNVKCTESGKPSVVLGHAQDVTDLSEMQERLRTLSLADDLTGLYNRRGFLKLAGQYFKLNQRKKEDLMLLFADIDDLKQINDRYGHNEGSQAIIHTGEILRSVFRESDVIARIGGDEFVVLMIDTSPERAGIVSARLEEKLKNHNETGNHPYELSLSVGMTHVDSTGLQSFEETLMVADKAMYEQKRAKRAAISASLASKTRVNKNRPKRSNKN